MTIDEQLAELRDKIARAGSCWGSTDARVADDAKHMLCKLATADFPRAIAAIEAVSEWCNEMLKDSRHPVTRGAAQTVLNILAAKLAVEV